MLQANLLSHQNQELALLRDIEARLLMETMQIKKQKKGNRTITSYSRVKTSASHRSSLNPNYSKTPERFSKTESSDIRNTTPRIDTGLNSDRSRSKSPLTSNKPIKQNSNDGWQIVEYENGSYEGHIQNNKRNGKGTYQWKDGNRYEGHWVDDQKEGPGKFVWTTGEMYEGEYKADKRHGVGIKTYTNGDMYEVQPVNPRANGKQETNVAGELTPLLTVTPITACSRTTRRKASESRSGFPAHPTRATGTTTRCTDRVCSNGRRETPTMESTTMG